MDYRKTIPIGPGKMGNKLCICGLRLTVYDVLDYLASGMTESEILADFPDLLKIRAEQPIGIVCSDTSHKLLRIWLTTTPKHK